MGRFKRGAFQIAFDVHLPVVPLSLTGLYDVLPKGKYLVHPGQKVKMKIGKPIDLSGYTEDQHLQAIEDVRQLVIDGIE